MNHLVFVYGALKRGFHFHYLIEQSEYIGSGKTVEKYAMYVDGIPYVTKNVAVSRIQGEVYSVDDNTLRDLDSLEQHPEWYCREKVDVVLDRDESVIPVWVYFNDTPVGKSIIVVL